MDERIEQSRVIVDQAMVDFKPFAVVAAISGGDDSLTAYYVAKLLGVPITHIIHIRTGTGIEETTRFVKDLMDAERPISLLGDAGNSYEERALRFGFPGKGRKAHNIMYHLLKAKHLRGTIASSIRRGKRNRNVLLINGARSDESKNRKHNFTETYNTDPNTRSNIWVNIIHHWTKKQCLEFLRDQGVDRNPVTKVLCRSGECMCGTMQAVDTREEAAALFPDWGVWLDSLEKQVWEQGFRWRWGHSVPGGVSQMRAGQTPLFPDWAPLCTSCLVEDVSSSTG